MRSEGSAYLDRSGRVLVADATFRDVLGLPSGDASEALRERARADPALALLVAGAGPDRTAIASWGACPGCELARTLCADGMLLEAFSPDGAEERRDGLDSTQAAELSIQAIALARLAGSVAHDVKNPLNSMALQLALLGDKMTSADPGLANACAANLASIKNQIGRINDVVRRYVDIADPATAPGGFDLGGVLADAASLFAHEARRRRVVLQCDAAPGVVRAAGDAARPTRWLLGLLWRAVSQTDPGGKLVARASATGPFAEVSLEHGAGEQDPAQDWVDRVVADGVRDMGGALEQTGAGGVVRVTLRLPKEMAS